MQTKTTDDDDNMNSKNHYSDNFDASSRFSKYDIHDISYHLKIW